MLNMTKVSKKRLELMTEYFCAKLATLLQGLSEVWERFLFLFFLEYGPV